MFDLFSYLLAVRHSTKEVDEKFKSFKNGLTFKGRVDYYKDLPTDAESGDEYIVRYTGESGEEADGRRFAFGDDSGTNTWIPIDSGSPDTAVRYYNDRVEYFNGTDWVPASIDNMII